MATYEEKLAELKKKHGMGGTAPAAPVTAAPTSQGSKGTTFEERSAAIKKKWGAPVKDVPAKSAPGGTPEYPTANYEQTMRDAIPLDAAPAPAAIPSAQVNFAPMDEHQISGLAPDAIPSRASRPGRPAILADGLDTGPQPPVKEYDFATAGAEVGPVQTWQDAEREKAIRKYMPSQTPEGQAATQAAAEQATQAHAQRLVDIKANPDWLYAAIQEGRILPQDMQDVSANSIPWRHLAQNPESPWAKIGAKGLTDPDGARTDLLAKMHGRETTGYDVARAIKTAGTDVLLFGAQPVDVAPQTKAGQAAYTGTEIAGGLAQIAAAGATGGAAAESIATRLIPEAARATEAGNLLLRGARGVGTGLALQGAKEAAHVVGTGEVQPGAAGRIGREAAFFGILDTLMPSLGGVTTQGVHRALPEAIRDTVAGRAISAGAGGAAAGGTTSLLVNSLFQPENEQEASVWNRVLTDAVQIGLFGAVHGALGSTETGFKTQPPQEIIGQQIGGRIYRGIPEAELAAAQKVKGDLSQLGYTEFKPNSGVWQKRGPDGTLTGEVHEDVMVGGRQVPKIVADRAARFNRSAPETTPAEPQAPGALSAPPPVITPEQAQTQAEHILASAGGDRNVALGMLEEYQRNTSDPTIASMAGAIAEVIRGSAPVASPQAAPAAAPLPVPTPKATAKGPKPKAQPQTPVAQPAAQPATQPVTQAVTDARVAQLKAALPDVNEAAITRIVENSQDLNDQGFAELFTRITGQQSPELASAPPVAAASAPVAAVPQPPTPVVSPPPIVAPAPPAQELPAPTDQPAPVPEQSIPVQTTPPATEVVAQPPAPAIATPASDLEQARKRVTDAGSAINAVLDPAMQQVYGAAPESGGQRAVAIGKFTTHVMNGGEVSSRALQQAIKVPQNVANALNNAYHSSQALRDVITERRDAIAALRPLEAAKRQAQEVPAPATTTAPATSPKPTATKAQAIQTPLPPGGLSVRTSANYKGEAQRKAAADYDKAIDDWAAQNNHDRQGFQLVRTLFSDGQWRPAIRTTQAGAKPAPGWVQLTSERGESAGAFYAVDHAYQAEAPKAEATPAANPPSQAAPVAQQGTAQERPTEADPAPNNAAPQQEAAATGRVSDEEARAQLDRLKAIENKTAEDWKQIGLLSHRLKGITAELSNNSGQLSVTFTGPISGSLSRPLGAAGFRFDGNTKEWVARTPNLASLTIFEEIQREMGNGEVAQGTIEPAATPAEIVGQATEAKPVEPAHPAVDVEKAKRERIVQSLRKSAESLQNQVDAIRGVDRKANTARRANMAAGALKEADNQQRLAKAINLVADGMENGTLTDSLRGIRTKADVAWLWSELRRAAPWNEDLRDVLRHTGEMPLRSDQVSRAESHIPRAQYPQATMHKEHAKALLEWTADIRGTATDRKALQRIADISNDHAVYVGSILKSVDSLLSEAKKHPEKKKGYWSVDDFTGAIGEYKRAQALGLTDRASFHTALTDLFNLTNGKTQKTPEQLKQDQIAAAERELVGTKMAGYFPTPKATVEKLLEAADIKPGMSVLEPSAGKGNIADLIKEQVPEANLETVEVVPTLRKILEAKGHNMVGDDFLQHQGQYDRIVMNPPFENYQDVAHVQHAYDLLKPGGRLVAIMSESPFFRTDKKGTAFREWLDEAGGASEKLPDGSFKDSERSTGVATRMVVIDKPGEATPSAETRVAQESTPTTPEPQSVATSATGKTLATGDTATAKTERGTEVQTQYALVDAGNLVASHDTALKANPDYPQELQPRDRSRMASEDQINRIVGNLEPSFLGATPKASEGAPIVGPDLVVESGNGRTIALQRAYEQGHKSADTYKQWLVDNAKSFGLDPQAVTGATAPVLVRVRQTDVNRADFASQANEQSVAAMSATEQAVADAKKLTGDVMHWFNPTDSGELVHPGNRDFIRTFLQKVVGPTEQGRYLTADGTLSREGIARIRNAVFAKAYGDSSAIEKLAESPDNNVRAITTGMLTAAGRIAQVKEGIAKGQYFPVDLSQDITSAMAKLSQLRDSGQSVADFLHPKQLAFFEDDLSDLSKDILDVFEQHKRSPKKIGTLLMAYADAVEAAGDPRQQTLWSKANPTRAELWQAAVQTMEANAGGGVQASLFQDPGAGGQGVAAANEAGGTPAQAEQGQSQGFTLKDALAEERGGISMPGRKPAPVDPLTQEIDQSISWNGQKQPRAAGAPIKETVRKVGNAIVDEMFDSNAPIRRMQKALAGNKEVSTDMDAYLRLNLLPKAVPGYTEAKLHDLEHVLRPLGEKLKDYLRYADAKSTLWRAKQFGYTFDEGKLPMKESVAQAFVDRVEQGSDAKLLKDAYQGEQKLYDGMLDELKDAGMLNDEAIGKMRDAYGEKDAQGKITSMNYVPMFRDMKAETNVKGDAVGTKPGAGGATGQGRSSVNVPKATQAQHGSARKLMDPMERRIRYIARVIGVAERNKAGMALAKFAQSFDTNGDFMVKVAPPMEHVEAKIDNLMHQLEDMGFDPSDLVDPNATIEFFKPKWARGKNDTVVTIYQEGKATYWDMHDPAVLKAITTMEPSVTGPIAKVLDMAARGMTTAYRTGATISPSFTVANLVRDTAESYILSKHQVVPGQALFEALRLVAQKDPFVQRTIDAGLKQGGFLRPETFSTNMAREIADPRGSFLHVRTLWKLYQETREQPEFWTRLGEASLEYKARLKAGTPEEAAFLRAMYEGGRITLNFTRGGTTARAINRYVPFFKIPFEAGLRTYEAATENKRPIYDPRSFWFKAIIPATALALTTVLLNQDNEAYKESSDSERDKYVLIPVGKALIRIPKPNGAFGVYFNLVERSLRLQMMQDPKAFRDFGKGAVAEVSPRVSNPALELLVGFATKYSMSDDRDILTQPEQKLSATQQYDSKTSPTIKAGAQALGLSPKMTQWAIDKVIPGYSAGYFMTEDWIRKAGDSSQPAIKPEDYPVVGRFISRPGEGKQGRSVSLFYDRVQQTDQVYNDLRDKILKESRQPVQMDKLSGEQLRIRNRLLTEMSPEDKVLYAQRKPLTKWDDQLAGLRKKRDAIDANRSMNSDAKKGALEQINRQLTDTAQRALQATKSK